MATGGPRIDDVNDEYQGNYSIVSAALDRRGIENPIPYGSLWDWYGRWSSGDLPVIPLHAESFLVRSSTPSSIACAPAESKTSNQPGGLASIAPIGNSATGWHPQSQKSNSRQLDSYVAKLWISVAQAVYVPERYPTLDRCCV